MSTAALAGAALLPAYWLASRFGNRLVRFAALTFACVAVVVWAEARLSGAAEAPDLEAYRSAFALIGGAALVADRTLSQREAGGFHVIRPDIAEILLIALLAAVGVALVTVLEVSPIVVALLIVAGGALVPPIRRRVRPIEDALLADVRAAAAAQGAESERARLARDLHDVPLQELIGAIRQLEIVPGAEGVSDDLRALAGHLRNVAIELRPPVLDDLGLAAALDELAEQSSGAGVKVDAQIVDTSTFDRSTRPPPEVELALYRIASEAVANAVRHAHASQIEVRAQINRENVELSVIDNGTTRFEVEPGQIRGKRIGVSSMRRRAQAIDADFSIKNSSAGTEVHAVWHG
jgi:signal transduction histidine kinase